MTTAIVSRYNPRHIADEILTLPNDTMQGNDTAHFDGKGHDKYKHNDGKNLELGSK